MKKYRMKYFIQDKVGENKKLITGSWSSIASFDDAMSWISQRIDYGALISELTVEFK